MKFDFDRSRGYVATAVRMLLGWHLAYLGLWALSTAGGFSWSGPFRCAHWLFGDAFRAVSGSAAMPWVDGVLAVGLLAAGLLLIIGRMVRGAVVFAVLYFAVGYLINPPHFGHTGESHFMYIDRNLIEVAMLLVIWKLAGETAKKSCEKGAGGKRGNAGEMDDSSAQTTRRQMIGNLASLPVVAALGGSAVWTAFMRKDPVVRITGPAVKPFAPEDIAGLGHKMTAFGRIGDVKLSRLILGGNVIGGWAHGRDMRYYDKLVKAYHTDERVFRTFRMAEACGVNTILTNPALMRVINRYWREEGGKIQFISDCGHAKGILEGARESVENGASIVYSHGGFTDSWAVKGEWGKLEEYLEGARKLGVPVGIGCHRLETVKGCIERGLIPDFWMKTVHRIDYPTARLGEDVKVSENGLGVHDNRFVDTGREEVFDFMATRPEPWIAFKILGAGIEHPKDAFPVTFKGGADFACVGMYDYQMVEDVNIANEVFENGLPSRVRPWH